MAREISGEVIHASAELLRLRPDVPGARMWAVALQHAMLTYFEVNARSRFEAHSHESEQITTPRMPALVPGGRLVADNAINHQATLRPMLERALQVERVDALIVPIGKGELVCRRRGSSS
jgi:hypothetical protein